jgi:CBS domain-containing protein
MEELKASDLMSGEVVTISPKATVVEAARLMLEHRVSGLPVVDAQGQLVGVISEGDMLCRAEIGAESVDDSFWSLELARQFLKAHGRYVEDVMTSKVVSVDENTPLAEIARLLQVMRLKRVPVTNHGEVVGIVSRADVLRVLISEAGGAPIARQKSASLAVGV